ncbi:alpha/beta hydrolase [soil metagenome]
MPRAASILQRMETTLTPDKSPAWYDEQYNNRARIPGHPAILAHWAAASAEALAMHPEMVEVAYGDDASERLDVFPARSSSEVAGAPVLVYIHGGYWRALSKRDQSFIAPPFSRAGAMVVVPDYALCPAVTISHIVQQMVRALDWTYRHAAEYGGNPDRIVVAGHSAGGHLAAMLLACDWKGVASDLPADVVKAALSVSGLYDLEPLRHAPFLSADLGLTEASARRLSPAFMPAPKGSLVSVVGGDESEEFHRQGALIESAWGPNTVVANESVPGRNHMDVIHELADAASTTHALTLELLGLRTRSSSQRVASSAGSGLA